MKVVDIREYYQFSLNSADQKLVKLFLQDFKSCDLFFMYPNIPRDELEYALGSFTDFISPNEGVLALMTRPSINMIWTLYSLRWKNRKDRQHFRVFYQDIQSGHLCTQDGIQGIRIQTILKGSLFLPLDGLSHKALKGILHFINNLTKLQSAVSFEMFLHLKKGDI